MARFAVVLVPLLLVSILGSAVLRAAGDGVSFNYLQAGADWEDTNQFPDSQCDGSSQSPINIIVRDVVEFEDAIVGKLETGGIVDDAIRENVGQTFEVKFTSFVTPAELKLPVIDGQVVGVARSPDIFALEDDDDDDTTFASAEPEQFHFHIPSENMINGIAFPMEAHLVTKVSQIEASSCPADGCYVVFSIMFMLDSTPNAFIARIFQGIDQAPFDTPQPIAGAVSIDGLLPDQLEDYYYWNGSLTTPNCNENVAWIMFRDVQTVSQDQIVLLQKNFGLRRTSCQNNAGNDVSAVLECNNVGDIKNNRPVQDLNGRRVISSESDDTSSIVQTNFAAALLRRAFKIS